MKILAPTSTRPYKRPWVQSSPKHAILRENSFFSREEACESVGRGNPLYMSHPSPRTKSFGFDPAYPRIPAKFTPLIAFYYYAARV